MTLRRFVPNSLGIFLLSSLAGTTVAAQPTVEEALKLEPVQQDVEYDRAGDVGEVSTCTIEPEKVSGHTAWVVRGPNAQLLRRFIDTNDDNRVDQWCYFSAGLEVYRDLDTDFNGKADEYRWLGTAGIRWGLDKDENRKIETWKQISPEEVSFEFVAALRDRDIERFRALLITAEELDQLGVTPTLKQQMLTTIGKARGAFAGFVRSQQGINSKTQWVDFGGQRPALLPAGPESAERDLIFYDAVIAMYETGGEHGQVPMGTLLKVGDTWRLLANSLGEGSGEGLIVQVATSGARPSDSPAVTEGIGAEVQQLVAELEQLDRQQESAQTPQQQTRLYQQRADVLEKLAEGVPDADRAMWYRQLADMICAATQAGQLPEGTQRLAKLLEKLQRAEVNSELLAHVHFCQLQADYATSIQAEDADFAKVQQRWVDQLTEFVESYPQASEAAEAMFQLGVATEFAGDDEKAVQWYKQILSRYSSSAPAERAAGCVKRLESVGQPLALSGKTLDGRTLDTGRLRGKTVLLHYWATWCGPCQDDMKQIAELARTYARQGFVPVGINLDNSPDAAQQFVKAERIGWPQMFEPGGMDESPLATQLGVFTLPVMILVGPDGSVINRNVTITELESELKKIYR